MEWFLGTLILFMFAVGIYLLIRGPGQRMCTLCGGYGGQPQWKGGEVCTRCHGSGVIARDEPPRGHLCRPYVDDLIAGTARCSICNRDMTGIMDA